MHYAEWLFWTCAGVVEVSDSELSDNDMADDDVRSTSTMKQPLLRHTDPHGDQHLSRQGRQALKHLHAVDNSVRTVISAVSARTLYLNANHAADRYRRQESVPLWTRIRWWVIVIGAAFIILPVIFVLYARLTRTGS